MFSNGPAPWWLHCLRRIPRPVTGAFAAVAGLATCAAQDAGVDLTVDGSWLARGGVRRGQTVNALVLAHASWNTEGQAAENRSWSAYVSALGLAGQGPTRRLVGDLLTVTNAEGFESARLYSSWIEAHGRVADFRVGLLLADEEFACSGAGGHLVNASFGWPVFISANTVNTGPAFFAAGLGARLRLNVNDRNSLLLGVYDGDTFDSADGDPRVNRAGLHYRLTGSQGSFIMAEFAQRVSERTRWKLGGWAHSAKFPDVYRDTSGISHALSGGDPLMHHGNGGAYAVAEHAPIGTPGEAGSLDFYVRVGIAPSDRNAIAWAVDGGLAWVGPIPSRADDVLSVGFTHAQFSGGFADNARDAAPTEPTPDYERVLEISYTWKFSERFSVQPDIQRIWHTGGSRALRDATVVLLRVRTSF